MFDSHIQQLRRREFGSACARPLPKLCKSRIELVAHLLNVMPNYCKRGPIGRLVCRQPAAHGIDSEGEQPIKIPSRVWERQQPSAQQVSIEGLQVANIKDNPVPVWDRTLIKRIGTDDVK